MGFHRTDAKLRAKASMRGTYPHPMLVTLIYLLVTTGVSWVIGFFVSNPLTSIYGYLVQGYEVTDVLRFVLSGSRMTLFMFLTVLLALYTSIMSFGYASYGLRLARNEQPSYKNLLDGFALVGRVLLTGILISVFAFLWQLLAMIPYIIVMVIAVVTSNVVLIVPAVLLMLAAVGVGIAVVYRYRLAFFFLLDHPEDMTARQAITQSKLTMQGHKGQLFVMDLSFLGWLLLAPLTLGILSLWLTPYMVTAEANFYDAITGKSLPPAAPRNADSAPQDDTRSDQTPF